MANEYRGRGVRNTPYTIYMKVPPILRITQNLPASKDFVQNSNQELSVTILYESNFNIKWFRNGTKIAERNVAYTGKGPMGVTETCPVNTATQGNYQYWCVISNGYNETITSATCAVTVKLNPPNATTITASAVSIVPGETFTFNYKVKSEDPYRLDVYMATETGTRVKMKSIDKPAVGAAYVDQTFTVSTAEIDAARPKGKDRLNRYDFSVFVENDSGGDWSETVKTYMGKDVPSIATLSWLRNEEVDSDTACAVFKLTTTDTFFGKLSAIGGLGEAILDGTVTSPDTIINFSRVGDYSVKVNFPRDSATHSLEVRADGTLNVANTGNKYHRGSVVVNKSVVMAPKPPEPIPEFTYTMTEEPDDHGYVYVFKATAINTGYFSIDHHWTKDGSSAGWTNNTESRWVAGEVRTVARLKSPGGVDNLVKFKATNRDGISKQSQNFTFSYPVIPTISLSGSRELVTIKWYDSDGGVVASSSSRSSATATLREDLPSGYKAIVSSDLGSETWYGPQAKGKKYSRYQSPGRNVPTVSSVSYNIYDSKDRLVASDRYRVSGTNSGDVVWL